MADRVVLQLEPVYGELLSRYGKLLRKRSCLLRRHGGRSPNHHLTALLDAYDQPQFWIRGPERQAVIRRFLPIIPAPLAVIPAFAGIHGATPEETLGSSSAAVLDF